MKRLSLTPENLKKFLAGAKTKTRRVIVPQPKVIHEVFKLNGSTYARTEMLFRNPKSQFLDGCIKAKYSPSDRFYVPEQHTLIKTTSGVVCKYLDGSQRYFYWKDIPEKDIDSIMKSMTIEARQKRPGIFMYDWLYRYEGVITSVGASRVQDISDADIKAEGIIEVDRWYRINGYAFRTSNLKPAMRELWNGINGKPRKRKGKPDVDYSWEANPFVFDYGIKPA